MKNFLLLALTTTLLFPTPSQSDTNHFGAGGIFELDLGDSEIQVLFKSSKCSHNQPNPVISVNRALFSADSAKPRRAS